MGFDESTTIHADWRTITVRRENACSSISLAKNIAPTGYSFKVSNCILSIK
ncbi:hypothetical protein RC180_003470 [Salmonella enterica]|nr:hypothetical protein [Salmonella enterica subsp. enterica serovar Kiambu]EHF0053367.1 hypothetical protein [Salmonella enterica]ELE4479443.1 hypothetical protein [Salmonella enterica]ELZ5129076.1 hypothetical protein [Salmonella enterica]